MAKQSPAKTGFTINTTVYSDGQHTVVVKATDKAGRSTSHSATLNVDNTAPVITIGYPIANSLMGGDFTYKARIKELHSGLDKSSEQVFIDNQQIDTAGLVCTPAVGASIPCDKPDRTANHHPGTTKTHTIEIRARDKAGNVGSARIYNVTFDNAPPTLCGYRS